MKPKLLLFLIVIWAPVINAQEVISTAGTEGKSSTVQLSWTIGETVIETLTNANNSLTQGMHQGKLSITAINDIQNPEFKISAFPNPTSRFVKLVIDNDKPLDLKYILYDMNGNTLEQKQIESTETSISMEKFVPAIYFLSIIDSKQELINFKIIKN
ncbi:MAG: T9SS type A sorting domain-containing protein [Bacteroidota bacterium]